MITEGCIVVVKTGGQPKFFAIIKEIKKDPKPGWNVVTFVGLYIAKDAPTPTEVNTKVVLDEFSWILRPEYISGEPFTMSGTEMQLELIHDPYTFNKEEDKEVGSGFLDPLSSVKEKEAIVDKSTETTQDKGDDHKVVRLDFWKKEKGYD